MKKQRGYFKKEKRKYKGCKDTKNGYWVYITTSFKAPK